MKVGDRIKVVQDFIGDETLIGSHGTVQHVFDTGVIVNLDQYGPALFFEVEELEVIS